MNKKCHCCKKEARSLDKYGILWNAKCLLNKQKNADGVKGNKQPPAYEGERYPIK